ncbi:hypothetical protein [Rhizobium phage RHph_X2_30]|nr:hypothetical protein [Rhizobium phage RHph_X2_30]
MKVPMTNEQANRLLTDFVTEVRAATLARKGSKKQRDGMLGVAMKRAEIIELLTSEPAPAKPESPSTVWLVTAEHFSVAGLIVETYATEAAAVNKCVQLVNIMLNDTNGAVKVKPEPATVDTWQIVLEWLQDYHGAAHCFVEIQAQQVQA